MKWFRFVSLLLAFAACAPAARAAEMVRADHAEVRLIAATAEHRPGEPIDLGVAFRLEPGWHIYAANPGDAGLPTEVAWSLPAGASVGPLLYPPHKVFDEAGLTTYGYADRAVFTARAISADAAPLPVKARVSWLICKDICIPGEASLDLLLPLAAGAPQPSLDALLFSPAAEPAPPPAPALGLWLALALAFAGGAILNLMPCVLPILALKVLALAEAGRGAARREASLFALGALSGFVALGAALALFGAGGQALGWGFQLQSPATVLLLATIMLLVGLDLAGALPLGGLPAGLAQRLPAVRTPFFTGLLAVAVASPCTAPLMSAALGFAATQPPEIAFLVVVAVGCGFALPMLLAGWIPALARLLPKPGRWMLTLRKILALPMFAAAFWLAWVLSRQTDALGLALAVLVLLAAGVALRARRFALPLIGVALLIGATAAELRPAQATAAADAWSEAKVAQLRAEGRPVFVDFTAAWCLTCQVNKRTTLSHAEVIAAFRDKGVAFLVADWTQRDDRIGAALAQLGRNGVPVYALYAPGRTEPTLLPELLAPGVVLDALAALPPR